MISSSTLTAFVTPRWAFSFFKPLNSTTEEAGFSWLVILAVSLLVVGGHDLPRFSCIQLTSSDVFVPEIIFVCDALVSELLQMSMHLFSVSFRSCRSRFLVCGF